ncbi:prepilin-type N-terminal cleavage/methylation domain-containing protein [uncultured Roseobacter sp.]|uniref:PulJ/GspJ family protein n=1 Tax=uncultured Roseobacter sp. TaxID=114847 RepID=UPI00262D3767|nr:prepilin-type N-terminal cleavage/methylation domain-containing protein [uncultured Roseobacter sp.]
MTTRAGQSGVTLIEMLVALSVFSLIGLASFNVLDAIVRTDRQTDGRLEAVAQLDLALRIFEADVLRSQGLSVLEEDRITLVSSADRITYFSSQKGLRRRIERSEQPALVQQVLVYPARAFWSVTDVGEIQAVEINLLPEGDTTHAIRRLVPLSSIPRWPE